MMFTARAQQGRMAEPTPIVFVVDDDISVRNSLEWLIKFEGWQAETFSSAQEFLARSRVFVPNCLVLDVSLPGLSGLDLQQHIGEGRAEMPIIFITGHGDIPTTVRAMKAGAVEFLTKPFADDELRDAIRNALERSRSALVQLSERRKLEERYATLSGRERQVMALVVRGELNKQVAGDLGITEATVKKHRGRVMEKMKAQSLADLVEMAARLDLLRASQA